MIGLAVTGCGLTRQADQRREAAQRTADDSRCRNYGFRNDADLARCRMQLNVARLRGSSAGGGDTGGATSDTNALVSRCDCASRLGIDAYHVLGDLLVDRS
jgi:hypothetical protein